MRTELAKSIVDINRQFYQNFGDAFAATRRRIQPGIRRVLSSLPKEGNWLDLGCGSGTLALEWAHTGRTGSYLGVDFSPALLAQAESSLHELELPAGLRIQFRQMDLMTSDWCLELPDSIFDGIMCFAAMHHIPGFENRLAFLNQVRTLLPEGGLYVHSNWQFQNSPRLAARIQPWKLVSIQADELEEGDTLLDWRYILPGQPEITGYRYVHRFSLPELTNLAAQSGFTIFETFESDGEGGRLGLYQLWRAI